MSGNVWEWEDSCQTQNGATDQCRLRGGSFWFNGSTVCTPANGLCNGSGGADTKWDISTSNWLYNNITLDGSYFNNSFGLDDPAPGGQTATEPVPFDAVEQVTVQIAPFDVRQSGFTGYLTFGF